MEMNLNLRERTVLLVSPLTSVAQGLIQGLTQLGADIVIVHKDVSGMTRFCNSINDLREINPKLGRAMALQADTLNKKEVKEVIAKAAQTFGGLDIYIDGQMTQDLSPLVIQAQGDEEDGFEAQLQQNMVSPYYFTKNVLNYLKARKKGRILYLQNDSLIRGKAEDALATLTRTGFIAFAQSLSRQTVEFNVTVNVLSLGATEEYLLKHFTECTSIKEAQEKLRQTDPLFKITEPEKVCGTIAYLISNLGAAVNGQLIRLT
jgi:2-hydroxycyclohexanecarboxyl-CoA dehydrogenase